MSLFGTIIGFTGTKEGMSDLQKERFESLIRDLNPSEFHHGDCVGADAQAHDIVRKIAPACRIILHPPFNQTLRANCRADVILFQNEYIKRNHNIVDACEELIATPRSTIEQTRSGTWATIRYCKKKGKNVRIIFPY